MKVDIKIQLSALNFLLFWNFLIFVLAIFAQIFFDLRYFTQTDFSLFGGIVISRGELSNFYSIVTANFFHIDILHFLLNMYSLYRLGQIVEIFYGGKKLFATYILGGIGASILTILLYTILDTSVFSLGASGSIFALAGLLIGGTIRKQRFGFSLPFTFWDIFPAVILAFSVGLFPGSGINNWAHLGGFLSGFALGLIFKHSMGTYRNKFDDLIDNSAYYISIALFSLSFFFLILTGLFIIY